MKKFQTLIILVVFFSNTSLAQYFVPKGEDFVEKQINVEKKTIVNVAKFLGYNTEEFYTYSNSEDNSIWVVAFKSFTDEIIFVALTKKSDVLTKERVREYLKNYEFSKAFGPYEIESTLNDGIKNKSLSSKFLASVLKENNILNGEINANSIGYILTIKNGYLTEFKTSDGLNKWAKEWKEEFPERYLAYKIAAKKYWGENKEKIINEINVQADAYSRTPDCMLNEFIELHKSEEGTINFKMLLVAHYKEKINLEEFKSINYGRYVLVSDFSNSDEKKSTTYKVNKTLFTFSEKGELINSYTANY